MRTLCILGAGISTGLAFVGAYFTGVQIVIELAWLGAGLQVVGFLGDWIGQRRRS